MIYYINDVTIDNEEVLVGYGAAGTATGTYEYGLQRLSVEHVNEAKEYYLYNGTGNVTQTTAQNGSAFLRYTYDAFGNISSIRAPMTVDIDDLNRYTYNGEDYDYNTGLQYLRARYYDTSVGSFISQDTYLGDLLNPLSQNRYTYCHNSPVMFDDPSGHYYTNPRSPEYRSGIYEVEPYSNNPRSLYYTDGKEDTEETYIDENSVEAKAKTFVVNCATNISPDQELQSAIDEGFVTKVTIEGKNYYQFNDTFYFKNYDSDYSGQMILTAVDGEYRTFIVNSNKNIVSIPFGMFDQSPIEKLLEKGWDDGEVLTLYSFRSTDIPDNLSGQVDAMKEIAVYYSVKENSEKVGTAILNYLGYIDSDKSKSFFTDIELNSIAGNWSGSYGRSYFNGEIEAHAELLVGNTFITELIRGAMIGFGLRTEENYYKSLAIADLAKSDNNYDKFLMDLYWGNK